MHALVIALLISAAPSKPPPPAAEKREQLGCLTFAVPEGYATTVTPEMVKVSSTKLFKVAGIEKPDNFTINLSPSKGMTLDQYLVEVRKVFSPKPPAEVAEAAKASGGAITSFGPLTETRLQVGKAAAMQLDGTSTIKVRDLELTYVGPRVFVLHQDQVYIVAARYVVDRKKDVDPIAQAFVKSLRLDGCP